MHVAAPLDPSLPNMYDDLERGPKTGGGGEGTKTGLASVHLFTEPDASLSQTY